MADTAVRDTSSVKEPTSASKSGSTAATVHVPDEDPFASMAASAVPPSPNKDPSSGVSGVTGPSPDRPLPPKKVRQVMVAHVMSATAAVPSPLSAHAEVSMHVGNEHTEAAMQVLFCNTTCAVVLGWLWPPHVFCHKLYPTPVSAHTFCHVHQH